MHIPNELLDLLKEPQQIVVVAHKNPDGDAVGSSLALSKTLEAMGHNANCVLPNDFPDFLKWIPHVDEITFFENENEKARQLIAKASLIFTLDFNDLSRVGEGFQEVLEKHTGDFVMIDHHQEPSSYAKYMFSDPSKGSTCEMVYDFVEALEGLQHINASIASMIYVGIMTDTGSFRFPSTTSKTHRVAANLIDAGAVHWQIHQNTFDGNSFNRMQLLGRALSKMNVVTELHTAYIHLSQNDLDEFHFKKGDTEGFVNYALSLKNVVFAVIFIENENEKIIKISFRSKGGFDVNQFARNHFKGGGHKNAAGGRSLLPLNETISRFLSILPSHTKELNVDDF